MSEETNSSEDKGGMIVIFAVISLILSIFMGYLGRPANAGFWGCSLLLIIAMVCGTPAGVIGGLIGEFLRQIARPDMIITRNSMGDILKAQLFWAFGPQLIGMVIGSLIGVYLTAGKLGAYMYQH